jgi:hypothetical protein
MVKLNNDGIFKISEGTKPKFFVKTYKLSQGVDAPWDSISLAYFHNSYIKDFTCYTKAKLY